MWPYKGVSRKQFEERKDFAEHVLLALGAEKIDIELPYINTTTTIGKDYKDTAPDGRSVYQYKDRYYRIDEVLFPVKPFLVFEIATDIEIVYKNGMEDNDPFPYDLTDEEIWEEMKQM